MKFKRLNLFIIALLLHGCVGGGGENEFSGDHAPGLGLLDSIKVSSITRVDSNPTLATTVDFLITFDRNVTNVDLSDFSISTTGSAVGTLNTLSATLGTTFTINVNAVSGTGNLSLVFNDSDQSITNAEALTATTTFSSGEVYSIDNTNPTVGINAPSLINQSNESAYFFSGVCSENTRTVSGNLNGIGFTTVCSANTWSVIGVDTSFLADAVYLITANTTDFAGNASGAVTENVTKNTAIPLPSLSFLIPTIGFGSANSVTIRIGSIGVGHTVAAYSDNTCTTLIRSELSGGVTHDMAFANAAEGIYNYYFEVTDLVPASSGCLGPRTFVEDQSAPADPLTIALSSPGDATTSSDSTPEISGTVDASEEGTSVQVFRDAACTDSVGTNTVTGGAFTVLGSLALDGSHNGVNQFYIKLTDQAGNISSCWDSGLSYTLGGGGLASLPKIAMVGVDSPTQLVSLSNSNTITWIRKDDPTNPVNLGTHQKGDVINIELPNPNQATKVDQGDRIESTGPCYAVTQGYGTAPWASEAYAGTLFTTYQYRYGNRAPRIYVASVSGSAFVQVKQDTDGDGVLDVVYFDTIAKNDVRLFNTQNLVDGRPFQVVSTNNVNVYYVSSSNGVTYDRDARVLTPASTAIVGFSWYLTSAENGTNYNAYRNFAGANYAGAVNINQRVDIGRTVKSSMERWGTYATADKPISILQIADQDGVNATPSLPVSMLSTNYGIPRNADYVGIIALGATDVQVNRPDGSLRGTYSLNKAAGSHVNAPHVLYYRDGATIPAGTTFECTNPCFMIYDDESPGADRDETIMMGFTP